MKGHHISCLGRIQNKTICQLFWCVVSCTHTITAWSDQIGGGVVLNRPVVKDISFYSIIFSFFWKYIQLQFSEHVQTFFHLFIIFWLFTLLLPGRRNPYCNVAIVLSYSLTLSFWCFDFNPIDQYYESSQVLFWEWSLGPSTLARRKWDIIEIGSTTLINGMPS